MHKTFLAALAGGSVLAVAACGSSSSGSASYGSSATSAAVTTHAAAAGASTAARATVTVRATPLGTILVNGAGRTLYLFDGDRGSTSACTGGCARVWPPLLSTGAARAGQGVNASLLGTTSRAGGQVQVTYAGHPLYTYVSDTGPGMTTGQGVSSFGATWWVVGPAGKAVGASATPSGGGGAAAGY